MTGLKAPRADSGGVEWLLGQRLLQAKARNKELYSQNLELEKILVQEQSSHEGLELMNRA